MRFFDAQRCALFVSAVAAITLAAWWPPLLRAQTTWELVWQDEFDGAAVDQTKWSFQIGDGCPNCTWGNGELQWYREENATVENGLLIITAKEESFGGLDYTSARMRTINKGDWLYGRFEIRAKLPIGQGLWPAIWMLPTTETYGMWAASGEIDIMEMRGRVPNEVLGTIYYGRPFPEQVGTSASYVLPTGDFSSEFHVFELQWDPWEIRWYVDGQLFRAESSWFSANARYPAPFDQKFHLLLNVAVGGNFDGPPDATTQFPQSMEVDYVRVYEARNANPTANITEPVPGQTFSPGDPVTISATAVDADGTVERVDFYQDDGLLGTRRQPPYTVDISDLAPGCFTVRAVAVDNVGRRGSSDVDVKVGESCPEQAPYLMSAARIPGVVEAEYYDLGGEDIAYNDTDPGNSGRFGIRPSDNVDIAPAGSAPGSDMGYAVVRTNRTEWLEYTVEVEEAGVYDAIARVGSSAPSASFQLEFDGIDKTGRVTVPPTGSETEWSNLFIPGLQLESGIQTMRLVLNSAGLGITRIIFQKSGSTAIESEKPNDGLELYPSYPNPTRSSTTIRYRLPQSTQMRLTLYDLLGREVAVLASGVKGPGTHQANVNTTAVPAGVYVYRLHTPLGEISRLLTVSD